MRNSALTSRYAEQARIMNDRPSSARLAHPTHIGRELSHHGVLIETDALMPKKPRLDKPADWTGHWWLPEDPDNTVAGVLRYDPAAGLRLDLIGGFENRILRPIKHGSPSGRAPGPGPWSSVSPTTKR